ncbi:hypothetical protein OJF2_40440 [Aquisphaera giovannonii]|uniref:DUF937 domain-containing protein n=1 Tax=Aquisphaera giovannonii TaxID=406548 RepID=A0A5B9W4L8_9BACT|nr:DUF937 domain-containing protein [Aquisphaera giovannonii]QEH35492.1 hypothetical protein OJF2_40440 [Aquisphaera giovannonii]
MTLIELFKNQMTPEMLGKLASLLGLGQEDASRAVSAAVPALLSAFAGLASSPVGAEKFVSTLRSPDLGSLGGPGDILGGGLSPAEMEKKGGSILSSLLGSGGLAALAGALAKFIGGHPDLAKKLLTFVGPFVLSSILSQFKGRNLTAQGLTSLFAENKESIAHALPAGFQMPSLSRFADAGHAAASTAAGTTEGGLPKWLLPLVLLGLLAAGLWWLFGQNQPSAGPGGESVPIATTPPRAPAPTKKNVELPAVDAPALSKTLAETYKSATLYLTDIKDVPTAEAALPRIQGLNATLDTLRAGWDKLPDSGKASLKSITSDNLGKLKDLVAKVLAIPGVADKLKPALDVLVTKFAGLG